MGIEHYETAAETAKRLNTTAPVVYKLTREGRLPHRRLGRKLLYVPEEVDAALGGVTLEELRAKGDAQ